MRDDFTAKTKQALALRAGYHCSFRECDCLTVGPSDESSSAVAMLGVASHIHAAAPGGRRYKAAMSAGERKDIANGIWLCTRHATLIDRDEATYTASVILEMKLRHEASVVHRLSGDAVAVTTAGELVALGPEILCVATLIAADDAEWTIKVAHFVSGDVTAITNLAGAFALTPRSKRFVLLNELGDGRILAAPPAWRSTSDGIVVSLRVEPRAPRSNAQALGADLKLGPDGDLSPDFALVSGLNALPQRVQLTLWWQQGQYCYDREAGTRVAEYFHLFGSTPWFAKLIKLETIRMASIPHVHLRSQREDTPFACVDRVLDVELLESVPTDGWLRATVRLSISGVGDWTHTLRLYVPPYPFLDPEAELERLVAQAKTP